MTNDFVHLHVHSEYSMLDGLGRIKKLVAEAKRLGQPALALTDHGVMHGAIEFFRACKGADVKPIIGIEAYQTLWGRPMNGRDGQADRENYHLLLLARNMTGYRNLLKIASRSSIEGYYYKPRVDHDFLARHAKGIICSTGCLGAEVPQLIMQGRETEAYERLGWYVDVFGRENFFIELQEHTIPELVEVNKVLVPWADKFNLQLVATNDVHYVAEEDGSPHDVLLCVQTGARVHEEKRMRLSDQSYFLKSRAQMEETFRPLIDLPASAFDHTVAIAEMCEVDLEDKEFHLPDLPIPEGFTYETYLRHLTEEGLARLYGDRADDRDVQERKERELRIIHEMGFDVYFLIVADLCDFARSRNIWWNVRGSGAGSLVAYCIGITGLDPLKNNLIFERFLNPGRVNMPDFDLDYPDDQREEMIRYTVEKYGSDQVAQIVTFGRMKARAAIRDVGRAKDIALTEVDKIAKMIPAIPGKPATIQDVLTEGHEFYSPELEQLYQSTDWVRDLIDTSMRLEGVARHAGIHAAAVIVADRELEHYAPLMRGSKSTITETIAQYEFPILESIGLLKVDFLGLSTLSVVREAGRLIQGRHGIDYNLSNIPFEGDEAAEAFKLLSSGEVSGVFQVESQGMRRVLTEMRPSAFEHIIATISLYRPGPLEYIPNFIRRMHGEEEVAYHHSKLEPILSETYGICVSGDTIVFDAHTGKRFRLDEVGDAVEFSIQGIDDQWQPAIGRVTHWIDSGIKPVYAVRLRNGATVKITADHRVLTETGWRPLCELAPGDFIAAPQKLLGPGENAAKQLDRRRLRVLAYLIADGSLASMASVDFVSKDPTLIEEYLRCLVAFPDTRAVFTKQVHDVTRVGVAKSHEGEQAYHAPNSLLAWMRRLGLKHAPGCRPGGLRSHEKFIPPFVFELHEADIEFFLASLWECDGHMGRKICHYRTISRQLATDVQTLLLRTGIRSVIHESAYSNASANGDEEVRRVAYQVTVYDTQRLAQQLQPHMVTHKGVVQCTGHSASTILRSPFLEEALQTTQMSARGIMREYGVDRQHFYAARRSSQRISSAVAGLLAAQVELPWTTQQLNIDWQEIVSIEPAGDEHVYDLTVEGLHNFVANNIIVHNCVYQEQIIQILSQLAGYTPGDADLVRRAIGKKKAAEIERHKQIFIDGCEKNDIPKATAKAIYEDIEFFARYGFNKCLPGDVEVVDAATGRLVCIEDLYAGRDVIDETVSCNTERLTLTKAPVSAVMDNGVKAVYRIATGLGRSIEATANHPFYTFDGWRQLGELAVGDTIATPRTLPVEGTVEWPEHEVIALGHLLAEGSLCHPHSVYFYSQDHEQVEDYVRAAEQFANVECSIALHRGTYSVYARRVDRNKAPGIVRWSQSLAIWGKNAREKCIPDDVFTLTNPQLALLVARMWEGDGHINVQGRSLFYATASERMARQLQHIFLRFGIISKLRTVEFPYKDGRIGYQLFITGNENLRKFRDAIGIRFLSEKRRIDLDALVLETVGSWSAKDVVPMGVKDVVRSAKAEAGVTWQQMNTECGVAQREFYPTGANGKHGFSRRTIARLADYFESPDLRRYAENDLYWDRIVAIEYVGEKQTYDLEVPGVHNFVANDILVHNSHAADYAVICVQTAFLKAQFPVEYMAALLLIERDKTEKVTNFINECRRMGIDVLPPDINYSGLDFEIQALPEETESQAHRDPYLGYEFPVPEGSAIRFGMAAIKNVGEGPVQVILDARTEGGPFASLDDLCDRVDLRKVTKRALEFLIKAGALDRFGKRSQLLAVMEQMIAHSGGIHAARESGQLSMFDMMETTTQTAAAAIRLPDIEEAKGRERLQWEKELLGVYTMSHPLQHLSIDIGTVVTCASNELDERYDGKNVTMAGMIAAVRVINTKKGDQMAFVQLEDLQGQCEVVVFPRTYAEYKEKLVPDTIVLVKGKAQTREGSTSVLADSLQNYVDQARAVHDGEEDPRQTALIDVAPTINGVAIQGAPDGPAQRKNGRASLAADPTGTADAPVWPEDGNALLGEPGADYMPEENPFRRGAPIWAETGQDTSRARQADLAGSSEADLTELRQGSPANARQADSEREGVSEAGAVAEQGPAYADDKPEESTVAAASQPDEATEQDHTAPDSPGAGADLQHTEGHNGANGAERSANGGRRLIITFRRSGDTDRDKYRLKSIYERVRDPRGHDEFAIRFESRGRSVTLDFPNDPCTVSERLTSELTKHFRVEVRVDE